jgi:uncharacterized protein (TIGR00730 family)
VRFIFSTWGVFRLAEQARKIITIFGSSRSNEGDPDYREAHELGRLLAEAGFTICSGGYSGSMEAVSRGAREGGGKTIGVTVDVIRRNCNEWLDEEIRMESIFKRIERMATIASGFVVLRGGAGTLAEMALTMNLLFLGALEPRPVVLLGQDWRAVMELFFERLHSSETERQLLTFAATPSDVAQLLVERVR